MRFSPVVFASGVLALIRPECFSSHGSGLAAFSDCANQAALSECLSQLEAPHKPDVEKCLLHSGCSDADASYEARVVLDRCEEWVRAAELRRRAPTAAAGVPPLAQVTVPALFARQSTLDCFTERTVTTSTCPVETNDGTTTTGSCTETQEVRSECAPGLTCSLDRQGTTVCMELQNALDTAGIIIAIIFGVAIALAIGTITFLCCKDRREHKRLAAKAEATALARAATKKQRAAEVRAPLMSEQPPASAAGPGGPDPFSDRHHS